MSKTYNFFVYIVTNYKKTVLYVGVTNNLQQRIKEHYDNRGKQETFAGKYYCYNLVYYEWHQYINNAIGEEKRLKELIRAEKEKLITDFNPNWHFFNKEVCGEWPPKYEGRLGSPSAMTKGDEDDVEKRGDDGSPTAMTKGGDDDVKKRDEDGLPSAMTKGAMTNNKTTMTERTRAQESRAAIQQLYISMRHLFIRGGYKPLGVSGEAMIEALMVLRPEIYGSIADPERVELEGLLYIFQRLPQGIEECRFIRLITKEGFEHSGFTPIIPPKRRRNCYRIDDEQMFIELTNGRSDIYDILTHLTFLYIEAEKVRRNALDPRGRKKRDWHNLEKVVEQEQSGEAINREVACTYLSGLLGRTFEETLSAVKRFEAASRVNSLFHIVYWMGKLSIEEELDKDDREITFSAALREKIGHHIYGGLWADNIKQFLHDKNWLDRPIHIISSNPHSVMNCLYAFGATKTKPNSMNMEALARELSHEENKELRNKVVDYAARNGMYQLDDTSGTNIAVQIIDTEQVKLEGLSSEISWDATFVAEQKPLLLVMDYAFGEQAYEVMDELLKPFDYGFRIADFGLEAVVPDLTSLEAKEIGDAAPQIRNPQSVIRNPLNVASISIMGKAGILEGGKGDIMVPTAHVFEGTADNYPIDNDFKKEDFEGQGLRVGEGTMITVLGTSLQNKDILRYFLRSSWRAVGLEMEGAHYQKAIQAASKIRKNISENVVLRYAYYASDNPLLTGHTLASGSLGEEGVKPTYLITQKILNRIFSKK